MYSLTVLPYVPYVPSLNVLSGNTFTVTTGAISVQNSQGASLIIGSQVGNQVSVGGGWPFPR